MSGHLIISDETVVWRYFELWKLISLLERKALFFPSGKTLQNFDKYEGYFGSEFMSLVERGWKDPVTISPNIVFDSPKDFYDLFNYGLFFSCWHMFEDENFLMWKSYADHGIAIKTTVGNIRKSILSQNLKRIVPVEYVKEGNLEPHLGEMDYLNDLEGPYQIKRNHFEGEQELRLVSMEVAQNFSVKPSVKLKPQLSTGIFVPVDVDKLIGSIFVNPASEAGFLDSVKGLCSKYRISKRTLIRQSHI